jgi:hypothetical protein
MFTLVVTCCVTHALGGSSSDFMAAFQDMSPENADLAMILLKEVCMCELT